MTATAYDYTVVVDWTHDRVGNLILEGKPTVQVATPPEFDGVSGVISPEDLFVAAAASCMMTTFVAFCKKMRLEFKSYRCEGVGTLEKLERGFEFTSILLTSTVSVQSKELAEKTDRAMELAGKYCLVANSMKCTVNHANHVIVEP
jgi:organic hydroperoxide reductase OsmC/OhrA